MKNTIQDTDFSKNPYDVSTDKGDVEYILKAVNDYFPHVELTENDVMACYSGVRPLVNDGSETEGKTSREHSLFAEGPNLSFIAGGKYTTYRKMSEDAVNFVLKKMPFDERMSFSPSDTKRPLNEKVTQAQLIKIIQQSESLAEKFDVSLDKVHSLIERHGLEALDIQDH